MRLGDARSVINEVDSKSYSYLKQWGLSTIKEAIRTIKSRVTATYEDKQKAEQIGWKIARGW